MAEPKDENEKALTHASPHSLTAKATLEALESAHSPPVVFGLAILVQQKQSVFGEFENGLIHTITHRVEDQTLRANVVQVDAVLVHLPDVAESWNVARFHLLIQFVHDVTDRHH